MYNTMPQAARLLAPATRAARIVALATALLAITATAHASDITEFKWNGGDIVLRFAGEFTSTVDLAATDSTEVVIRIRGRAFDPADPMLNRALDGPQSQQAILTLAGTNELRLTIRGANRIGFTSLVRPYSHTLLVHTFQWDRLEYPQERYYRGLIALEQGLDAAGLEFLEVARATGDNRAASVLGVYYARSGNYKRAAQYLAAPIDADDYAALAETQRHTGDAAGAEASQHRFEELLAAGTNASIGSAAPTGSQQQPRKGRGRPDADPRGIDSGTEGATDSPPDFESNDDLRAASQRRWLYLLAGVVLLIAVVAIVSRSTRRGPKVRPPAFDDEPFAPMPPPEFVAPEHMAHAGASGGDVHEAVVVEAEPITRHHDPVAEPPIAEPSVRAHMAHEAETRAETIASLPADAELEATQPVVVETVIVETIPPGALDADVIVEEEYVVERAIGPAPVEARAVEARIVSESAEPPARSTPTQAAELRSRIESMREQAARADEPPPTPGSAEQETVAEARRLRLSRDSVELRRRMESMRGRQ